MLSILDLVAGRPWAIRADMFTQVRGMVEREGISGLRHLAALKAGVHAFDDEGPPSPNRGRGMRVIGSVGVVSIGGVLTSNGDIIGSVETRSTQAIAREVSAFAMDTRIDSIMLSISSPGGEVEAVHEAWMAVRAADAIKPVISHAWQSASAAVWIQSATREKWVAHSGGMGSVGVYAMHADQSKALEAEGVKVEFIVSDASPYKVEGNSYEPLGESGRAHFQQEVNRFAGMFVGDMAKAYGVSAAYVLKHFGQGRMLSPEEAVAAKMADQIGTFEQAIRRAEQMGASARRGRKIETRADDLAPEPMAMEEAPITRIVAAEPDPEPEPAVAPEPAAVVGLTPDQIAALARLSTL